MAVPRGIEASASTRAAYARAVRSSPNFARIAPGSGANFGG